MSVTLLTNAEGEGRERILRASHIVLRILAFSSVFSGPQGFPHMWTSHLHGIRWLQNMACMLFQAAAYPSWRE